jgi:hypothetical protein
MSGYIGGSSIIRGGQFSSYDPAEGVRTPKAKKRSAKKPSKTYKKNTSNIKRNKDPQENFEAARKNLLHIIIDQILAGIDEIKVSNTKHSELQAALDVAGSPITWASSQKEFATLTAKKIEKREKRLLKLEAQQQASPVIREVKLKKKIASRQSSSAPKAIVTAEAVYQSERSSLIRSLVDQMIQKRGKLMVSNLKSSLSDELAAATSPLLWLQAQPDYKDIFKARYFVLRKAISPQEKPLKRSKRRRNGGKRKYGKELVSRQDQATPVNQKKKRKKRDFNLKNETKPQVTPLSDVPVSYILKKIDKASEEPLNTRKVDWDLT